MSNVAPNRVRELRQARGLSQIALADRSNLTRQSVHAIEAGRASPAVDVALRLATALDCRVEDLFGGASVTEEVVNAESVDASTAERVALAQIGGRWFAYGLVGETAGLCADGLAALGQRHSGEVKLLRPLLEAAETVVLTGCAAGLGVLANRLNSRPGPGRFLWRPASNGEALRNLVDGKTHIAGIHLVDPVTGETNVVDVRSAKAAQPLVQITLGTWEQGLLTRRENKNQISSVTDLGRSTLRLVLRESGSGARSLLEKHLHAIGCAERITRGNHLQVYGHLDVARAVAMGAADTGVASRDAALALGLRFMPLAVERYDLVLPLPMLTDPRIQRLLDSLTSRSLRAELTALGYDPQLTGSRVT